MGLVQIPEFEKPRRREEVRVMNTRMGKTCPRCQDFEPNVEFGRHKTGKNRKRTYCRSCERDINMKTRATKDGVVRKRGAKAKNPPGWVTITVPCRNADEGCDRKKEHSLPIEQKDGPHYWYCHDCIDSGSPEHRAWGLSKQDTRMSPGRFKDQKTNTSQVKIFRPGDKGFKERAAQCTHISEIKSSGEKNPSYMSGMGGNNGGI